MSLYRVTQVGFNISTISGLLPTLLDTSSIKNHISDIRDDITQLNTDVSGKVSKSGDTMTWDLIMGDGSSNDSPGLSLKEKDYGLTMIDQHGGVLRFLSTAISEQNMYLGKYTLVVNNSPNLKYSRTIKDNNNVWKNAPEKSVTTYYYEGSDTITLDLPHPHCFVTVQKMSPNRGVAMAYSWNGGTDVQWWINRLHDTWLGWERAGGSFTKIFNESLLTNSTVVISFFFKYSFLLSYE